MWIEALVLLSLTVVFVLTLVFANRLYQPDRTTFGVLSEDIYGPCSTQESCTEMGERVRTQTCTPNAETGKGCIDPSTGLQIFSPIREVEGCRSACNRTEFIKRKLTPQDGLGDSLCRTYTDDLPLTWWWDGTGVPPEQPVSLPDGQCADVTGNNYARFKYVCEVINPNGINNGCITQNSSTGEVISGSEGYQYFAFEPCVVSVNRPCGSWTGAEGVGSIDTASVNFSNTEGGLFLEYLNLGPSVCQVDASKPCEPGNNACITYGDSSQQSENCDVRPYQDPADNTVCHSQDIPTITELVSSAVINNRRILTPFTLESLPPSLQTIFADILFGFGAIGCPGTLGGNLWENNPYYLTFERITMDSYEYDQEVTNQIKNRSGFFMSTSGTATVLYLAQQSFKIDLQPANVTPLDFTRVRWDAVQNVPGCNAAQVIQANGILLSPIPVNGGRYKFAALYKGNLFGWLFSGSTLLNFISPKNDFINYVTSEIAYIDFINPSPGTVLYETRAHLEYVLNNWDDIITSVDNNGVYWFPARVSLLRPSSVFAPTQEQAEIFNMTLEQATYPVANDLPQLLGFGQINTTNNYLVTQLETSDNFDLLPPSGELYLNLSIAYDRYTQFPALGQSILDRGSSSTPYTMCTVLSS